MPELECLLTSSEMSDDDFVFCFSDTSCARVSLLDELNMQPTEPTPTTTKSEAHILFARTATPVVFEAFPRRGGARMT